MPRLLPFLFAAALLAQRPEPASFTPDPALFSASKPDLRAIIERYAADLSTLQRYYQVPLSSERIAAHKNFESAWLTALEKLNFDTLPHDAQIDWLLLRNHLRWTLSRLDDEQRRIDETRAVLPFLPKALSLLDARRRIEPMKAQQAAATLHDIDTEIARLSKTIATDPGYFKVKRTVAFRALNQINQLKQELKQWHAFYTGYDPLFTWWTADPQKKLDANLDKYAKAVREKLVGLRPDDKDTIIGDPIGREPLLRDLQFEMLAYTPEELIEIANREFAWCERELLKASREMGFGDDWRKAQEQVKNLYVPPGEQTELIRQQVLEAIDFVTKRDLVTVPPYAAQTWRMAMMSPERQRINPFFLGGETIIVSFPTDTMTHEEKLMSMRGNNIHFARAVTHHEVIPGHYLQQYSMARYRPYRRIFNTPFWIEGWALHWEYLLWDLGFARSPEDRMGMLFWRMHRCARIIFSLSFHLEKMTAQECVDFLVNRVGFERENAAGEVRRSFESGLYPPLYQAAYMLGALQINALHADLVGSGKMTNRAFHDAILQENVMPIELVRAALTKAKLSRDFAPAWRFYRLN